MRPGALPTFSASPAAVSWGPNRIDVSTRGGSDVLLHKWWDGGAWSSWENLGGVQTASPAAASWGVGRLDVFVQGQDSGLWQRSYAGTWSGFASHANSAFYLDPAAISTSRGEIDVFVPGGTVGTHNHLLHTWFYGPRGNRDGRLAPFWPNQAQNRADSSLA